MLEHELGHDVTGLRDPDNQEFYPGSNTIFDTGGKDNIAVNENPFREYLGLPARINHDAYRLPDNSWFDESW